MVSESEIPIPMISVELQSKLEQIGIESSVNGRMKTPYSIWMKTAQESVNGPARRYHGVPCSSA